ncbi:diflavin flavoprotein [Spirulina sp. CS-785/01]|uniref:diflavin flavoprotein n=1 Tax=Spirulina sp. CS-785/01 TaxID=3021716 RepID=UPI00232FEC0F|nr:diflavin flavoprotein [Spirulina sp. CS-785/01]MDB9315128.1 diflavin flavoprotein [Spirulina sp. CS-785/01]
MKPRDVQVLPIAPETTVLRSRTWERLKFEIEYALQKGTTANSFIIQGDKTALFDPPGESFTDSFISALQNRIDPKTLDYVILGHVNPNRGATLKVLLDLAPQITLVCSNPAAISLRKILEGQNPQIHVIKKDDSLDLGQGHQLQFILTPSPRWSDQMCTYDPKTEILYTDKLFGAHVCGQQIFDEGWQVYNDDRRYYFDCLMAPHATQVSAALAKLTEHPARLYATGHGPLVRYGLQELTQSYENWVEQQKKQENSVTLLYASAYGNTATIAQAIARGITKAGVAVQSINCEQADPDEITTAVEQSAGFIMGSPTLGGHAPTQVQTALGLVLSTAAKSKLAGVFGSFGWSGEAIDILEQKIRDAGYKFGFDPIRVKFKPTDQTLKYCEEAGTDFAQKIKRQQKSRKPRSSVTESQSARTEQAVGRIVGSLSVVTTKKGELSNAMLASWVSQASFSPPGLTVAVAKERAIEGLLYNNDQFVLNILKEGKQLRKHFMKNFAPGEDRFEGLDVEEAENGCPILKGALAYLECRVSKRMECGDHWLVYAVADSGNVFDPDGVTAVHHRKTGVYY